MDNETNEKYVFLKFLKLMGLALLCGMCSGLLGALFAKVIVFVTALRGNNSWLIYLLPLGGIAIVWFYKYLNISGMNTNDVLKAAGENGELSPKLSVAVFVCSAISHLFGASVGREGAALQLGGGTAEFFSRVFKLDKSVKQILVHCGMAGFFSALFGTPIAAFIFSLEVVCVFSINLKAILPTFLSSISAFGVSHILGVKPERFNLEFNHSLSSALILKVILISLLTGLLAVAFCASLNKSEKLFKTAFKNEYIRISVGGVITILFTLWVGSYDYNGAGINVIERIFEHGEFVGSAFFIKIIFTCVAVAAGYKGGEIVPTLFIGATFGALIGSLLGLSPAFSAAIGMTALFCGVTNCPLAAMFLSFEAFSWQAVPYIILSAAISFLASGKISLYSAQKVKGFKKLF